MVKIPLEPSHDLGLDLYQILMSNLNIKIMKKNIVFYLFLSLLAVFTACEKDKGPEPVADFSITGDSVPAPANLVFQNKSEHASTFHWDFGDNSSSEEEHPEHTYTQKGKYTVRLSATGPGGSSSYATAVTILDPANIIPGTRAGDYYVNETWGSIKSKVSSSSYWHTMLSIGSYYYHLCSFRNEGVSFFFRSTSSTLRNTDNVLVISVEDPFEGFTDNGITIGSKVSDVIDEYGPVQKEKYETIYYDDIGIDFGYDDARLYVEDISVYEAESKKSERSDPANVINQLMNAQQNIKNITQ